jgi:putative flippase GtrA
MTASTTLTGSTDASSRRRRALAPQYGQFVLVGLTGVGLNLAVFALTIWGFTGRPPLDLISAVTRSASAGASTGQILAASALAFAVATLWNFALNSVWTFRTRAELEHSRGRRLGLYYAVSLGSLGVNELVLYALLPVVAPLYGQAVGILAGSVVGFFGNRRVTFAERPARAPGPRVDPTDAGVSPISRAR